MNNKIQQQYEFNKLHQIMDFTDQYIHLENPREKTMPCNNENCARPNCSFAHSLEELRIFKCRNEQMYPQCTNPQCTYLHRNESKRNYFKRLKRPCNLPDTKQIIVQRTQPCKYILKIIF